MAGDIIAIDLDRDAVRAVVVSTHGRSGVVTEAVETSIDTGFGGMGEHGPAFDTALAALAGQPPKRVVVLTSQARSFTCDLSLPLSQVQKLGREKLEHAARWEIEPYLDFPASEALLSVAIPQHQPGGYASKTTTLQVCVAPRELYAAIEGACQVRGMKLLRLYAPDNAFAYSGVGALEEGGLEAVVSLRNSSTAAAMKRGQEALIFRSIPAIVGNDPSSADELVWAIADTVKDFTQAAGVPERVILADAGAAIPTLAEQVKLQSGIDAAVWSTSYTNGMVKSECGTIGPQYASAVGAALQELGICGSDKHGVDNRIPVAHTLRSNLHVAIVTLIIVLGGGLGLNYYTVHSRTKRLASDQSDLKTTEQDLKFRQSKAQEEEEKIAHVETAMEAARKEIAWIDKLRNAKPAAATLLEGLRGTIPYDVVLYRVEQSQASDREFMVSGWGWRAGSISEFQAKVQEAEWSEFVSPGGIYEKDLGRTAATGEQEKVLTYQFTMTIRLKAE